ncbi:unnamed protein product [Amoebophrya sp. A120]|nr:unnamed protein product [Amoebophrya sp. A120]|eukprot:GSA120T00001029001.1
MLANTSCSRGVDSTKNPELLYPPTLLEGREGDDTTSRGPNNKQADGTTREELSRTLLGKNHASSSCSPIFPHWTLGNKQIVQQRAHDTATNLTQPAVEDEHKNFDPVSLFAMVTSPENTVTIWSSSARQPLMVFDDALPREAGIVFDIVLPRDGQTLLLCTNTGGFFFIRSSCPWLDRASRMNVEFFEKKARERIAWDVMNGAKGTNAVLRAGDSENVRDHCDDFKATGADVSCLDHEKNQDHRAAAGDLFENNNIEKVVRNLRKQQLTEGEILDSLARSRTLSDVVAMEAPEEVEAIFGGRSTAAIGYAGRISRTSTAAAAFTEVDDEKILVDKTTEDSTTFDPREFCVHHGAGDEVCPGIMNRLCQKQNNPYKNEDEEKVLTSAEVDQHLHAGNSLVFSLDEALQGLLLRTQGQEHLHDAALQRHNEDVEDQTAEITSMRSCSTNVELLSTVFEELAAAFGSFEAEDDTQELIGLLLSTLGPGSGSGGEAASHESVDARLGAAEQGMIATKRPSSKKTITSKTAEDLQDEMFQQTCRKLFPSTFRSSSCGQEDEAVADSICPSTTSIRKKLDYIRPITLVGPTGLEIDYDVASFTDCGSENLLDPARRIDSNGGKKTNHDGDRRTAAYNCGRADLNQVTHLPDQLLDLAVAKVSPIAEHLLEEVDDPHQLSSQERAAVTIEDGVRLLQTLEYFCLENLDHFDDLLEEGQEQDDVDLNVDCRAERPNLQAYRAEIAADLASGVDELMKATSNTDVAGHQIQLREWGRFGSLSLPLMEEIHRLEALENNGRNARNFIRSKSSMICDRVVDAHDVEATDETKTGEMKPWREIKSETESWATRSRRSFLPSSTFGIAAEKPVGEEFMEIPGRNVVQVWLENVTAKQQDGPLNTLVVQEGRFLSYFEHGLTIVPSVVLPVPVESANLTKSAPYVLASACPEVLQVAACGPAAGSNASEANPRPGRLVLLNSSSFSLEKITPPLPVTPNKVVVAPSGLITAIKLTTAPNHNTTSSEDQDQADDLPFEQTTHAEVWFCNPKVDSWIRASPVQEHQLVFADPPGFEVFKARAEVGFSGLPVANAASAVDEKYGLGLFGMAAKVGCTTIMRPTSVKTLYNESSSLLTIRSTRFFARNAFLSLEDRTFAATQELTRRFLVASYTRDLVRIAPLARAMATLRCAGKGESCGLVMDRFFLPYFIRSSSRRDSDVHRGKGLSTTRTSHLKQPLLTSETKIPCPKSRDTKASKIFDLITRHGSESGFVLPQGLSDKIVSLARNRNEAREHPRNVENEPTKNLPVSLEERLLILHAEQVRLGTWAKVASRDRNFIDLCSRPVSSTKRKPAVSDIVCDQTARWLRSSFLRLVDLGIERVEVPREGEIKAPDPDIVLLPGGRGGTTLEDHRKNTEKGKASAAPPLPFVKPDYEDPVVVKTEKSRRNSIRSHDPRTSEEETKRVENTTSKKEVIELISDSEKSAQENGNGAEEVVNLVSESESNKESAAGAVVSAPSTSQKPVTGPRPGTTAVGAVVRAEKKEADSTTKTEKEEQVVQQGPDDHGPGGSQKETPGSCGKAKKKARRS